MAGHCEDHSNLDAGSREPVSAQMLSDCWHAALGFRPASNDDTLLGHRVSGKARLELVRAIRSAFAFDFDSELLPPDMPFGATAGLLSPLVACREGSEPNLWLAPGLTGIGLGELLLSGAYAGPGRIQFMRYPSLEQIGPTGDVIEAHVHAVLRQLPENPGDEGLALIGFSLGAHILHETACRLERRGVRIARLVLIHAIARPRRSDLTGYDVKLIECRRPGELIRAVEWKMAINNRLMLRLWRQAAVALEFIGLAEAAYRFDRALSCVLRLKEFCYSIRHSQYQGEAVLLRPAGTDFHPEADAGWSAFCPRLQIRSVPVPAKKFVSGRNREMVAKELAELISEFVPPREL